LGDVPYLIPGAETIERFSQDFYTTSLEAAKSKDGFDKGGFPGPIGAEETNGLTFLNGEGDLLEDGEPIEAQRQ
jgi:hypothetical protein